MVLMFTNAVRTILVLVLIWLVLRMFVRAQQGGGPGSTKGRGFRWVRPDQRAKGDVRIERPDREQRPRDDDAIDTDFEEVH
ncbi:MAG: hypothetical protein H6594_11350 [Flavobacteriales bacterium]|nr:hypothetical protein [Flavobacteriales bacterium]